KSLAGQQGQRRLDVVNDGQGDPSGHKVPPYPLQVLFWPCQMIEDMDEGNGVEEIRGKIGVLVESIRYLRVGQALPGSPSCDGDRLEPIELLEPIRPCNVEEEADVAADVQDAAFSAQIGSGETVVAQHGAANVGHFLVGNVGFAVIVVDVSYRR